MLQVLDSEVRFEGLAFVLDFSFCICQDSTTIILVSFFVLLYFPAFPIVTFDVLSLFCFALLCISDKHDTPSSIQTCVHSSIVCPTR